MSKKTSVFAFLVSLCCIIGRMGDTPHHTSVYPSDEIERDTLRECDEHTYNYEPVNDKSARPPTIVPDSLHNVISEGTTGILYKLSGKGVVTDRWVEVISIPSNDGTHYLRYVNLYGQTDTYPERVQRHVPWILQNTATPTFRRINTSDCPDANLIGLVHDVAVR
jgi:hypothetical protein